MLKTYNECIENIADLRSEEVHAKLNRSLTGRTDSLDFVRIKTHDNRIEAVVEVIECLYNLKRTAEVGDHVEVNQITAKKTKSSNKKR